MLYLSREHLESPRVDFSRLQVYNCAQFVAVVVAAVGVDGVAIVVVVVAVEGIHRLKEILNFDSPDLGNMVGKTCAALLPHHARCENCAGNFVEPQSGVAETG